MVAARLGWIFDALPPSGARRGGDPSEHAFKHDLDTFVREVLQNANDQRIESPSVALRAFELTGARLAAFMRALEFQELQPHLVAVESGRVARRIRQRLRALERTGRLRLLLVEDRGTIGLTGAEREGTSHFRALCKDVLYSHKPGASAGGSFGLGKSVLWTFSGLSTVIFNSTPREALPGKRPPRLIGRAELPSHDDFAGPGWFGLQTGAPPRERADSVWGDDAADVARALELERPADASGTSILIVDFEEPATDEDVSLAALHTGFREAAARWFWPALCAPNGSALSVRVDGAPVRPDEVTASAPFVACLRGRVAHKEALEEPGDIVRREISFDVPGRATGERAFTGKALLLVRLAEEGRPHPLAGRVAFFRGAGIVVRYLDRSALAAQHRPFHAIVCCGEARDPAAVTDEDRWVEAFLRDSEPPGHDDWESTPALKDGWGRGYAKALEQLKARALAALKEVLAPAVAVGRRGPELLQRRFPLGGRGGGGSGPSAFSIDALVARLVDGRWRFEGMLAPTRGRGPWSAEVRLREVGEDGKPIGELAIAELSANRSDAHVVIEPEGYARVTVPGGNAAVAFEGTSQPLDVSELGVMSLEVTGRRA